MARKRTRTVGNGDTCPIDAGHGAMLWMESSQHCPVVSHNGRPKSHPLGYAPPTRKFWPQGHDSFRKAVIQSTLPEVDIELLGG